MKESVFANEIKQACRGLNAYYYKIPDAYQGERFLVKKPYDAVIVKDGIFHAVEFKIHKVGGVNGFGAFPYDNVKQHQIEGLNEVVKFGGKSFVMVNFRVPKIGNRVFFVEIEMFMYHQSHWHRKGRRSIPFDYIEEEWTEAPRTLRDHNNKLTWDISQILPW